MLIFSKHALIIKWEESKTSFEILLQCLRFCVVYVTWAKLRSAWESSKDGNLRRADLGYKNVLACRNQSLITYWLSNIDKLPLNSLIKLSLSSWAEKQSFSIKKFNTA